MITATQSETIDLLETIRKAVNAAGSDGLPSSQMYSLLMPIGIDFPTYDYCINLLKKAKVITVVMHTLYPADGVPDAHKKNTKKG